jgi:hypothetical protein
MKAYQSPADRINLAVDPIGHGAVQPWSAGPYFPAVIFRQDVHDTAPAPDGSYPLRYSSWCVTLDGVTRTGYASHDDAESVARGLVDPDNSAARARWSESAED